MMQKNTSKNTKQKSLAYLKVQSKILCRTDLDSSSKLLYSVIDMFSSYQGCYLSNTQLADFLGVSKSTVIRSISNLTDLNLITIEYHEPNGINSHRVMHSSDVGRRAIRLFNHVTK